MNMKKMILITGAALSLTLSSCSSESVLENIPFFNTDSASVVSMIDAITVADLTTEQAVEDAYVAYSALDDSVKSEVSNIDKLLGYRKEITKLYDVKDRLGDRIDHSEFLIGTYCVNPQCWTEEGIKALADCGIDVVTGGANDKTLLDLCEKNGVGVFLSYLSGWYGGDGSNAGGFASAVPAGTYSAQAENFVDHPAIWAMDVGDEPNSAEFPHYGVMIDEAEAAFPDKQIYLNLYPNYASEKQMGCKTYYEYIEKYVENIDTDYICYDHYIYAANNPTAFFSNLGIVSQAAIEEDRDFWIVLQVSADHPENWLTTQQLRYQAYSSMAFGTKVIHWACWTAGWYILHPVDGDGNLTEEYPRLQTVNHEIKELSPIYMRYTCKDTAFIDNYSSKERVDSEFLKYCGKDLDQKVLSEVKSIADSTIVMGYFEKNVGDGSAFMITNVTDPYCETENTGVVKFKTADTQAIVTAYFGDAASRLIPDSNGYYTVYIENGDGIFVTVE